MLPVTGIGIFGSDPVSKILIQILKQFKFDINALWTNNQIDQSHKINNNNNNSQFPFLITNSIDKVLLNKDVNLIFICCQPNLHSQISSKALGIGKHVVCLFPTCKEIEEIQHMIISARYYPTLVSSVSYGGLKYLSEFKLLKQSIPQIGEIKLCNITINCQNLALARIKDVNNIIDIDSICTPTSPNINWLGDKDLGAGVLNRFGAAMISLILNLFDDKKVTKVYGSLKTLIENCENFENTIRKITADDHCTFQLNLEPGSVLVNVNINSLACSKYTQEISLCGTKGTLSCKDTKVYFKSLNKNLIDQNNNNIEQSNNIYSEIELFSNEPVDKLAEDFLNNYKHIEDTCPELPVIYVRGLYYYLENFKNSFIELNKSSTETKLNNIRNRIDLENFEHTRIVQLIIKKICLSSSENRWINVNY